MSMTSIVRLGLGFLALLWGLYNANLYFRKEGNRFTSALAALILFGLGAYLLLDGLVNP